LQHRRPVIERLSTEVAAPPPSVGGWRLQAG